jgi:hypothetical protein
MNGLHEQLERELAGRRLRIARAMRRRRRVEADHGVEVQRAGALILRDLDVGDTHAAAQLALADAGGAGELTGNLDRGAAPELGSHRVPEHCVLVLEALPAERLAELGVVVGVYLAA